MTLGDIACVASVSVASGDALGARKLGLEQKKEGGGGIPPLSFFCSRPNFHAAKTSKFATETLAPQAIGDSSLSSTQPD